MESAQRLVGSKRGTLFLAILAAVVAGLLVLVYVKRYRDSVAAQSAPVTVLVAKATIPKGTSGKVVAAQGLYTVSTIRQSQLLDGAISDPSSLAGHAATEDIPPGAQLTSAEFSASATSVASTLTAHQRVVSIPFDASHGATPDLTVGDHVDVYAGFNVTPVGPSGIPIAGGQSRPVLKLVMQDIPVVRINGGAGGVGGGGTEISLKVNDIQAGQLAFATDNGKLWLAVRPASGAAAARPSIVTAETLLLGISPIAVERALGGKR
jgi:Flp pilus assembly protein CpaB